MTNTDYIDADAFVQELIKEKPVSSRKVVYTLDVDNYCPEITRQTFPYLKAYADKIGADFYVISEREFPSFPVTYEKFQIYKLAQDQDREYIIYIDADALVHPDTFDVTEFLDKGTVMTCKKDFLPIRFGYNDYFRRYGKHVGAGNWFTVASNWCTDIWQPLEEGEDWKQTISHITPTQDEKLMGITPEHLIDDYLISRNIAKFGLNYMSFVELLEKYKNPGEFLWHEYLLTKKEKIAAIKEISRIWNTSLQQKEAERRHNI